MPKKIGSVTRQALVTAPLPPATQTYTVISHQFVIDTVMNELNTHGFSVEKELYKCTDGAQVATGLFKLTYGNDPELSLMYAFGNSYDKTMKFKSAVGAYVNQNDTVMISRFNDWTRKHTGSADDETVSTISNQIADAARYFDELKSQKDMMSNITVTRLEFASIVGQLYFLKFITADQISMILKEYDNPSFTYTNGNDNLWTCYNHILIALKRTHPKNWIDNQIAVHLHICNHYKLFDYDEEEVEDVEVNNEILELQGDVIETNEEVVENSFDSMDPKLLTIEEESTIDEEFTLPGFDNPEPDGDEDHVDGVDEVIEEPVTTEEPDTDVAYDLDAEEDADWDKLPIEEVTPAESFIVEEEPVDELNEDELSSQLYGVDNNPESVIATTQEEVDEETIEEPVQAETFYFMKEDYEGVEVGDYIEEEGVYYNIINDESGDDGDFWVCIEVDVAVDETEEQVIESTPEIKAEIDAVAEVYDEEELPAELEAIVESIEASKDEVYQDPAIVKVIKSELEFLYDYDELEFTYKLEDGQYNITLNTGEVCSLAQGYVEQQV